MTSSGLQLARLQVARITTTNNIQWSWASLIRLGEISLDVLSETCLIVQGKIKITVHYEKCIKYCERCLEKWIACTNWNNGENVLFSQDCSRKYISYKVSLQGRQGSYEQLEQNPDVLIVLVM